MAVVAATRTETKAERHIERWYAPSAAATDITMSTTVVPAVLRRLLYVTVKYATAPTQAGVTVTLNSGAGAAYDTLLTTGTANALNTFYLPGSEVLMMSDDVIDVVAPSGGGAIVANVAIYTEILGN